MRCRYFLNSFIVKWNRSKILDDSSPNNHKKEGSNSNNLLLHALHVGSTSSLLSLAHSTTSNSTTINTLNAIEEKKLQADSISLESVSTTNNFKLPQNLPQIVNPLEKNLHFELPISSIFFI